MFNKILFVICSVGFGICSWYLLLPASQLPPSPPPNTLVSNDPADTESIYRHSFYSNYSREEIISYYRQNFSPKLLQERLNYPHEDAQGYIRDQAQSSWLEELVHPGRDSLFINGFYPTKPTEQINIKGVHYQNKITIHMLPSTPITRITVLGLASLSIYFLIKEYAKV